MAMMMQLCLEQRLTLRQRLEQRLTLQLRLLQQAGGFTRTVFPRTERSLRSSRSQQALQHVKGRSDPKHYWSVMDWLFCNVFPHERPGCFAFYREKGPPLRILKTKAELRLYDSVLLGILKKAKKAMKEDEQCRWTNLAREARAELGIDR